MPTVGSTGHVSESAIFNDGKTYNQYATLYQMPEDGVITRIGGWLAGYGGSCSFRFCLWSGGKSLLAQTALVTAASRSFGVGNSDKYEAAVSGGGYEVSAGTNLWVGWARNDNGGMQVDLDHNGAYTLIRRYRDSWPGSMVDFDSVADRKLNIYFKYESNPDVFVRRSGSWDQVDGVYVRRSGSWEKVGTDVYVRRSGSWEKA